MNVGEVAWAKGILIVDRDETLRAAACRLAKESVGALVACIERTPVGMFGESDLVRAVADRADLDKGIVGDYMSTPCESIEPSAGIEEAIHRMNQFDVRHLPVVRDTEIIGLISARDILRVFETARKGSSHAC